MNQKLNTFKQKYFTNNFYWVNESNYKQLQEIAIEVGCLLFTKEKEIIKWHDGFNCLGFRTRDGQTYFQKEAFLTHNETATDYNEMILKYKELK